MVAQREASPAQIVESKAPVLIYLTYFFALNDLYSESICFFGFFFVFLTDPII